MAVPLHVFANHSAIVGRTGSGKSFLARRLVELWLDAGERVCVMDPTDCWYGLRSNVAGDGPGYPVIIFGGAHADVPIGELSGARIAEIIAERNMPAVIVTAEMTGGERHRFMTDFLGSLYRRNKTPIHLVLDEADDVAPQNPLPESRRMLGDVDRIVRRGRVKGFRVTMITQRPAVLNKNVLSQASTLVAMRLPAPQDRKAIEDWIKGQANLDEAKEVLGSLSKLDRGEGWVWAPDEGVLTCTKFPMIHTFDSMRTPEYGKAVGEPTTLAPVELDDLIALMQATHETASDAGYETHAQTEQRGYERGLAQGRLEQAEWRHRAEAAMQAALGYLVPYSAELPGGGRVIDVKEPASVIIDALPQTTGAYAAFPPTRPEPAPDAEAALPTSAAKMLTVLSRGLKMTWAQTATLAGLKARGGSFNTGRKALRDSGYIIENSDGVEATAVGIRAGGGAQPKPDNPSELLNWWRSALPTTPGRMLEQLCRQDGKWVRKDRLAGFLGVQPRGGSWNTALSTLRQNGLIEIKGDQVRAHGDLCG